MPKINLASTVVTNPNLGCFLNAEFTSDYNPFLGFRPSTVIPCHPERQHGILSNIRRTERKRPSLIRHEDRSLNIDIGGSLREASGIPKGYVSGCSDRHRGKSTRAATRQLGYHQRWTWQDHKSSSRWSSCLRTRDNNQHGYYGWPIPPYHSNG